MADRLRYAAPPMSRAEFERRGLRVKEEISFQGGDGYLPFMTPAAATATMRQILAFALDVSDETGNDPIYAAPDFAAEFFATVQQEFTHLVDDPDYAALLSLFGTNLLYRTGSRPVAREAEEWGRPSKIEHPAQLRAIPNNAILQQLGFMANHAAWDRAGGHERPGNVPGDARAVAAFSAMRCRWSRRRSIGRNSTCCGRT